MRVFVTGGNGFIGSRVVRLLLEGGDSVRCLLRESSRTHRIEGLDYEKHIGDLRDIRSLIEGMGGCEAVIHLAAVSSWPDIRSSALESVVIDGTRHVFEASRQVGGLRCVYVSSVAAINGSKKPILFDETATFELDGTRLRYAIAKHRAEQIAAEYYANGLPVIVVNPVEVYGPDDEDFITACNVRDILQNAPAISCKGGTAIAHVDDVADGIVKALKKGRPGERYILGGDNLTIEEIVRLTLKIAGHKTPVLKIPNAPLRWVVRAIAKLGLPAPVVPEVLDYATRYFFVDTSKAMNELGYSPRPASEVLAPVVDWLRRAGHV